jgi:hypothetical protein
MFWFDGDSYSDELGQRMWKMCAYGALWYAPFLFECCVGLGAVVVRRVVLR